MKISINLESKVVGEWHGLMVISQRGQNPLVSFGSQAEVGDEPPLEAHRLGPEDDEVAEVFGAQCQAADIPYCNSNANQTLSYNTLYRVLLTIQ